MLITGCDRCKDTGCYNGDCERGTCNCFDFYEGDDCKTRASDKFVGFWTGDGNCLQGGSVSGAISVVGKNKNQVIVTDGADFNGYVDENNYSRVIIPEQKGFYKGREMILSGTLDVFRSTVTYSLYVEYPTHNFSTSCEATLHK